MGPLRSALAAARRQRRRRGVFVSLYRPCCGAAAAIARRRHGPAGPPNTHPPARPPSWRHARPPAATATEARAPATPFSFLCLCPRDRLLAGPIARLRPALCPSRGSSLSRQAISALRLPRPLSSRVRTLPPRAQPGFRAVWVSGPGQRLSGCPSSSPPGPRNLPGRPTRLLGGRSQSARRRR